MSITTVPLRPVGKSGLVLLWLGVLALIAFGAGYAYYQTKPNLFTVVKEGVGASPSDTDIVLIKYQGKLSDGTVFDQNEQAPLPVAQSVPGFRDALKKMKKGGKYKIIVPPELGYGAKAAGPIPANSTLYFDVELLDFRSEAEVRAMQQVMQQQQGMPGGPPPGAGPPLPPQ